MKRVAAGLLAVCVAVAAAGLAACAEDPVSPEERLRGLVAEAKALARKRDVAGLKRLVSEDYRDARGNDRRALMAFLTVKLMGHGTPHLLSRVRALEIEGDGRAKLELIAGMAAQPASGPEELFRMHANVYRIELELREEDGAWRVVSAAWRPATARELL